MTSSVHSDDALLSTLRALAPRLDPAGLGISGLRRLSGGATQEIWRFDLDLPDGKRPLIVRRAPGGTRVSEQGIGLEAEARLIAAAGAAGVPVPAVPYVFTPEDGLGHGFVMGFVEGETLGGRIIKADTFATARTHLARDCGEILARIHSVDVSAFPALSRLPPSEMLAQSREAYRKGPVRRPVFDLALRWLADHCPPAPARPALIHGDFRNGNLMIGPEGVRAVLDWELAHVGDPMEDLGWICVNSWRFGRIDKPVGGFGDQQDLFAGYAAAGGEPVDPERVRWWEAFGTMRWGVMCAGSLDAFRSVDRTHDRAMITRRASETEIDLLRLMKD